MLLDALAKHITNAPVLEVIILAHQLNNQLVVAGREIGVVDINPHAGEYGHFGDEEQRISIPAIEPVRARGIHADCQVPVDTLFPKAKGAWYDATVVEHRGQGEIRCRVIGSVYDDTTYSWATTGINVTLALPTIGTSVDTGTAFDRTGKRTPDMRSVIEATRFTTRIAKGRWHPKAEA